MVIRRRVWLDTNFLMLPAQFRVDIFAELARLSDVSCEGFELAVPSGVVSELKSIAGKSGKAATAARVALSLVESRRLKIVESEGRVDDWLAAKADEGDIVGTNDIGLIRRLRERNVRRIQLVGRGRLGFAA
jgi:rRNA-processing protein FCF1